MSRENQQEIKIKDTDIAWLAGMFNGDGCFSMSVRKKHWKGKESIGVDLSVTLTQADAGLVEEASRIIEGITDSTPRLTERKPTGSGHRTVLYLSVTRMKHISLFLEALGPHLRSEKAARARVMLKYVRSRIAKMDQGKRVSSPRFDRADWALVQQFYSMSVKNRKLLPEVLEILND